MKNLNIVYSQRIAQAYRRLDPWNFDRGLEWYYQANKEAVQLAIDRNIEVKRAAAVIAVLSPGAKWERNLEDARAVCIEGDNAIVTTYKQNKAKALNILKHDDFYQFIGGKKVKSFYENISNPDGHTAVCLDRHMLRFLLKTQEDKELNKIFSSKKKYERLAEEIRRKAIREGLKPSQLQAMLWLQIRQN